MNLFILIVAIILLAKGVFSVVSNKKVYAYSLCFIIIGVAVLFYIIFNTATSEKSIKISNKTLVQISQINWKDEESLKNIGFEKRNQEYVFYDVWSIYIDKVDELPKKVSKYKNFQYTFYETRYGSLDVKRLFEKEPPVTRYYFVYVDGLKISMFEHENEGSSYAFEDMINKIHKRQASDTKRTQ